MSYTLSDVAQDFIFCDLCDTYTEATVCECGDRVCAGCLAAYGCEWGH